MTVTAAHRMASRLLPRMMTPTGHQSTSCRFTGVCAPCGATLGTSIGLEHEEMTRSEGPGPVMDRSFALARTLFAATRTDLHRSEKPLGPSSKDELQKTPNRKTPQPKHE